jgi:hypothetical protein
MMSRLNSKDMQQCRELSQIKANALVRILRSCVKSEAGRDGF